MEVQTDPKILNFAECVDRVIDLYKSICYSSRIDKLYNDNARTLSSINNDHLL